MTDSLMLIVSIPFSAFYVIARCSMQQQVKLKVIHASREATLSRSTAIEVSLVWFGCDRSVPELLVHNQE